jgi:formylglycine-generating enzyme
MRTATAAMVLLCADLASGNVFEMPPGLTNLEMATVGDPGNTGDTEVMRTDSSSGYGTVGYRYSIGKYEVTAGQYTEFLNKVAKTDTYGLYNPIMWSDTSHGCKIERSGQSGSYSYSVAPAFANRPANWVSWGDAARFANWLHNGQPSGVQNSSTTEDGAYYLNGATSDAELLAVTREPDATWVIPSEDEWYKAAYYKTGSLNAGYWDYPTSSDSINTDMANYDGYVGHTTDVGAYAYSSPYGTFDQGGNVWEWNEAVISGSCRGVRGGSFSYYNNIGYILLASYRSFNEPSYEDDPIGFRVVQVPEPATLTLLALGGLAVMRRR